ncbi:hypothetical protein YB2330_005475 [Saitoella coloradoensis]
MHRRIVSGKRHPLAGPPPPFELNVPNHLMTYGRNDEAPDVGTWNEPMDPELDVEDIEFLAEEEWKIIDDMDLLDAWKADLKQLRKEAERFYADVCYETPAGKKIWFHSAIMGKYTTVVSRTTQESRQTFLFKATPGGEGQSVKRQNAATGTKLQVVKIPEHRYEGVQLRVVQAYASDGWRDLRNRHVTADITLRLSITKDEIPTKELDLFSMLPDTTTHRHEDGSLFADYPMHKFVLLLRVPYFEILFSSSFGDANQTLYQVQDVTFTIRTFHYFHEYVYGWLPSDLGPRIGGWKSPKTDRIALANDLLEVYRGAKYYLIDDLVQWAQLQMIRLCRRGQTRVAEPGDGFVDGNVASFVVSQMYNPAGYDNKDEWVVGEFCMDMAQVMDHESWTPSMWNWEAGLREIMWTAIAYAIQEAFPFPLFRDYCKLRAKIRRKEGHEMLRRWEEEWFNRLDWTFSSAWREQWKTVKMWVETQHAYEVKENTEFIAEVYRVLNSQVILSRPLDMQPESVSDAEDSEGRDDGKQDDDRQGDSHPEAHSEGASETEGEDGEARTQAPAEAVTEFERQNQKWARRKVIREELDSEESKLQRKHPATFGRHLIGCYRYLSRQPGGRYDEVVQLALKQICDWFGFNQNWKNILIERDAHMWKYADLKYLCDYINIPMSRIAPNAESQSETQSEEDFDEFHWGALSFEVEDRTRTDSESEGEVLRNPFHWKNLTRGMTPFKMDADSAGIGESSLEQGGVVVDEGEENEREPDDTIIAPVPVGLYHVGFQEIDNDSGLDADESD